LSFFISSSSSSFKANFSVLLLIFAPICYGFGGWLNDFAQEKGTYALPFLGETNTKLNGIKLDRYIRRSLSFFSLSIEEYMKCNEGIRFETIFTNHLSSCDAGKKDAPCFCGQFRDKETEK